jgi:hypothetical protein
VWTKAPFLFRNELLPADGVEAQRTAAPGEVKGLGDEPTVIRLKMGSAAVEVATNAEDKERLLGRSASTIDIAFHGDLCDDQPL